MRSKLAFKNAMRSIKDYAIYFITLAFGVCIFYMFNSIYSQQAMLGLTDKMTNSTEALQENQFLMCFKNEAEPMNEEQLTNMFESFVRLDEARNEMEGSGMGLTIVKEIIELHQGNIWAEYEAGKLYVCIKMALFC